MKALRFVPLSTALLLAACGSQAQPAVPSQSQSAAGQAKLSASPQAKPAASSAAQSKSSWDDIIAAANKEGPPHPNAAKVYIDWLLSAEGQGAWSRASGVPSFRQDAPHEGVLDVMVPQPGKEYFNTYSEDFARKQNEAGQYVKKLVHL